MDRHRWAELAVFSAVAEAGSFTRAAVALGLTPSAVSHSMRQLETRLNVRLLNRTTRSLSLTEAGERLLATLRPAMADVSDALAAIEEGRERPSGRLRISVHRSAAFGHVLPRLNGFGESYPEIVVELIVDDDLVDIVAQGFDAGIRRHPALEDDMISVRLDEGEPLAFVGSPDYLRAFGTPGEPADLLRHRCINYRYPSSGRPHRWDFERADERITLDVPTVLLTNDVDVIVDAALRGCGLALMLDSMAAPHMASGRLARILPEWSGRVPPNYLYYAGRRNVPAALRVFIDAMRGAAGRASAMCPA